MVETDQKQKIGFRLARWIWWGSFLMAVAITLASLPGYAQALKALDLIPGLASIQQAAQWTGSILSLSAVALCLALALLVFLKRAADPIAIFLSFFLLSYAIFMLGPLEYLLPYWFPQFGSLALLLQAILSPIVAFTLLLIFPNGKFVPRWTRWLVVLVFLITLTFIFTFTTDELIRVSTIRSLVGTVILLALILFALGNQIYRYLRIYTHIERQQTKWVLIGIILTFVLSIIDAIPYYYVMNLPPGTPAPWWMTLGSALWWFTLMILPVTLTIAILRYRLFDIDILIRKTLVYGALTLTLALVYLGSVVLLQSLAITIIGHQSAVMTVISTLLIAALFTPLRRGIQNDIDRRFYRKKYDAEKTIASFSAGLRQEVDLEQIGERLMAVVEETMQPESLNLWLRPVRRSSDTGLKGK